MTGENKTRRADKAFRLRQSGLMVDILSNIVEFRNGESGQHVIHIRALTGLLLRTLARMDGQTIDPQTVETIASASVLHDIGKIAISDEILNKSGRLTGEEFSVMKDHAVIGANMLRELPAPQDDPLIKAAYEICRWHHERYDGNGYPDRLAGDDIPLSAQVVGLADVYDALTRDRVYKKAFPHKTAVEMILRGDCGAFNPLLLESLRRCAPRIPKTLANALAR